MLLDTFKTTDGKVCLRVAGHRPACEDYSQGGIVRQQFGRAVGLLSIARRLHDKASRAVSAQRLLQPLNASFIWPCSSPSEKNSVFLNSFCLARNSWASRTVRASSHQRLGLEAMQALKRSGRAIRAWIANKPPSECPAKTRYGCVA